MKRKTIASTHEINEINAGDEFLPKRTTQTLSLKVPELLSEYTLHRQLGSGSFGTVHSATIPTQNNRLVAIKQSKIKEGDAEFNEESYKDLYSEAHILSQLNIHSSPHIIQFYGNFDIKAKLQACNVFELLHGSLFSLKEANPQHQFTLPILQSISQQIAAGLHFFKKHQLVHADLSSSNIGFKSTHLSVEKTVKNIIEIEIRIMDFGASFFIQQPCKERLVTAPQWRAPEIVMEAPLTNRISNWCTPTLLSYRYMEALTNPAIDYWGFGIILTHMYSRLPFSISALNAQTEQVYLLHKIADLCGGLDINTLKQSYQGFYLKKMAPASIIEALSSPRPSVINSIFQEREMKGCTRNALFEQMIKNLLKLNPKERILPFEPIPEFPEVPEETSSSSSAASASASVDD